MEKKMEMKLKLGLYTGWVHTDTKQPPKPLTLVPTSIYIYIYTGDISNIRGGGVLAHSMQRFSNQSLYNPSFVSLSMLFFPFDSPSLQ